MWKCPKCKEECEDNFASCWNCSTGRDGSPAKVLEPQEDAGEVDPAPTATSKATASNKGNRALMTRYTDAYLEARSITAVGKTVKAASLAIAAGIALFGVVASSQSLKYCVGAAILAVIVAIPIYVLGIMVTAQGQTLKATLDAAVNSSQLLSKDEMRKIMSLD